MTPTVTSAAGLLAMAASPDQAVSPWVQLIPFALVLGIFYFVILLPMKRRQKKVQEFLEALKVGDRVVTTGRHLRVRHQDFGRSPSNFKSRRTCGSMSRARPLSASRGRPRSPTSPLDHGQEPALEAAHHPGRRRALGVCVLPAPAEGTARAGPQGRRASRAPRPDRRCPAAADRGHGRPAARVAADGGRQRRDDRDHRRQRRSP